MMKLQVLVLHSFFQGMFHPIRCMHHLLTYLRIPSILWCCLQFQKVLWCKGIWRSSFLGCRIQTMTSPTIWNLRKIAICRRYVQQRVPRTLLNQLNGHLGCNGMTFWHCWAYLTLARLQRSMHVWGSYYYPCMDDYYGLTRRFPLI